MKQVNLFQMFERLSYQKKCIIYGAGTIGRAMGFMMRRLNIAVAYYVDKKYMELREKYTEMDIRSPYDLLYENKDELFILICTNNAFVESIDATLVSMGLEKNREFYVLNELCAAPTDYFDPLLGYSRMYSNGREQLYGFSLYGSKDARYKIVTLGGSTTDDTLYGIQSWPEALYQLIGRKDVCVLNGGIVGYDSSQELMKLLRDVLVLAPDLVISFSGVNEKARDEKGSFPYASVYLQKTLESCFAKGNVDLKIGLGVENNGSAAHEFLKNQKLMHGICNSFGISCVTFLQPDLRIRDKSYYCSEGERDNSEMDQFFTEEEVEKAAAFFDEIDAGAPFSESFIDARGFLSDRLDVFVDWVHVNEEGNRLLASKIYEVIRCKLPEEVKI